MEWHAALPSYHHVLDEGFQGEGAGATSAFDPSSFERGRSYGQRLFAAVADEGQPF